MERMRTAEEMVEYCKRKGTASGESTRKLRAHFNLIQEALGKDEYVMCCFAAVYRAQGFYQSGWEHVEALTNKRLLIGREGTMQGGISAIRYDDINEIKIVDNEVLVDSAKPVKNAFVHYKDAGNIQRGINSVLPVIMRQKAVKERQENFNGSIADELTKLAGLKEKGILSEKEFQQQKALLLYPAEQDVFFDEGEHEAETELGNFVPRKVYRVKTCRPIHGERMDMEYEEMEERILRNDVSWKAVKKEARKERIFNGIRFCVVWGLLIGLVIIYAIIKD